MLAAHMVLLRQVRVLNHDIPCLVLLQDPLGIVNAGTGGPKEVLCELLETALVPGESLEAALEILPREFQDI